MPHPSRVIAALAVLASCAGGSAEFTPLNPSPHPLVPKAPEQVEVFEAGPPSRPHVDAGSFTIVAWGGPKVADFRKAAASRGCDGVVIIHEDDEDRGVCIVYLDAAPALQ
jgi:hypothetical protein